MLPFVCSAHRDNGKSGSLHLSARLCPSPRKPPRKSLTTDMREPSVLSLGLVVTLSRSPSVRTETPVRLALLIVSLVLLDVLVTSVLYHRSLTHRAVILNRWLARSLTVYVQGMAFAPPLTWVATHRLHHAHTDTPRDPYSPRVHGFLAVFLGTAVLVSLWRRRHGAAVVDRLTRTVPDRTFLAVCEWRPACFAITAFFLASFVLALGWFGLLLYVLQLVGFYLVVGWANSAGHALGERPFAGSATN